MSDYVAEVCAALAQGPPRELEAAAELLHSAVKDERTIYTFGNGACAALAAHIATDLGKGLKSGVRIHSLVDNAALLTAYANDRSYECVFEEQLRTLLRPGDVAFGISGSGTSPNVLVALEFARGEGGKTIALTGNRSGTERLVACCDVVIRAPLDVMEQIEDVQIVYAHALMRLLSERLDN